MLAVRVCLNMFDSSQLAADFWQALALVQIVEVCSHSCGEGWEDKPPVNRLRCFLGFAAAVIIPFLVALQSRAYAASLSFIAGVMPPMPMFGRSLLYVHSQAVANPCISSRDSKIY